MSRDDTIFGVPVPLADVEDDVEEIPEGFRRR